MFQHPAIRIINKPYKGRRLFKLTGADMDNAEIKTAAVNLEKAVKDKLPARHILDILEALKNRVVANEKVLRETKIGMAVNKLRAHNDKTVSELSKEIVAKWKKDVSKTKLPGSSPMQKEGSQSGQSVALKNEASPLMTKSKVDAGNRNKVADGVKYDIHEEDIRNKSIGMLYDGLCLGSDASIEHILNIAKGIEDRVYKTNNMKFDGEYRSKMRSLFLNLKDAKNPNLRRRVVSNEISPERLAVMSTEEMASAERKAEDKAIEKENMDKATVAKPEKSITDQLQCGKCKKKRVSYSQAQTRSADEPMTTFCECELCGHRWKFS